MKKIVVLILVLFFSGCDKSKAQDAEFLKGFRNPGKEFRPRAYWDWLNGDVSLSDLTRDLEEAKAKGLSGLLIWDTQAMINPNGFVPAGPPFLGNESVKAIHHSMKEAERLDLDLGLVCASGWNSGGSWVTPEMASKNLFSADIAVKGPDLVKLKLPFPEVPRNCPKGADGLPVWYMDVAVLAWPDSKDKLIPDISDIVNLTAKCKNGELVWTPPAGTWRVVRFVCSNNGQQLIAASPNSKGLFIDFLDPKATRFHFEFIIKKLCLTKGKNPGTALKSLDDDSMELHEGIQWTTKFRDKFQEYNGYDPISWLPVLLGWTVKDSIESERFQYDYKKTVSDLLIVSHYKTGSEVCAEYGLERVAEAGGPGPPFWETCPVDALKALGNVGIPRGEFWLGNPRNLFLVKEIASAAHIYGKTYADAESWTTWRRWRDGPFTLKKLVDRAFCEGLNRVTYHGFANSPVEFGYPGRGYHAGLDMNPRITWWSKARPFMDYLARCCYLLQQGLYVADVAYYYGDQAPNFWPLYHNVPDKPLLEGVDAGYEYDVVNSDVILNRMSVKDGRITLPDGMSYSLLMLKDQRSYPLEVLLKLEELVAGGATIIGPKPSDVPGMQKYESKTAKLREVADKMWGNINGATVKSNNYGKGKVIWGYTPNQLFAMESVYPDFSCTNHEIAEKLDFIHRKAGKSDIYFVRNKTIDPVNAECLFLVKNRVPQIWDPGDGSIKDQFIYKTDNRGTALTVNLPPGGAIFVVFIDRPDAARANSLVMKADLENTGLPIGQLQALSQKTAVIHCWQNGDYLLTDSKGHTMKKSIKVLAEPVTLKGDWTLKFDPQWGAPEEIKLPQLISWTDHPNEGVKYYSGTGTYLKTVNVSADWIVPGHFVDIDLGDVRELAEVFVNGRSAGIIWKPPFRTDITELLKPGNNELKIEVLNLWINRLSGDMNLPDDQKFTRTNIRSDGSTPKVKAEPWHIETSGLLGPVRLIPSLIVSVANNGIHGSEIRNQTDN